MTFFVVVFWLEVTYALIITKNHLLLLEMENFTCLGRVLQLLGTSMWSTTKPNVIIGMYCTSFSVEIANKVGYFCFFLTLTNFALTAFELKFLFYTAGKNIVSKAGWILSNFIYFNILHVFSFMCKLVYTQNICFCEK